MWATPNGELIINAKRSHIMGITDKKTHKFSLMNVS